MKKRQRLPLPGMRNIKTAVSVFLCLVIYVVFPLLSSSLSGVDGRIAEVIAFILKREDPMFACIAAIIVMQSTVADSVSIGKSRIYGTAMGAAAGLLFLCLNLCLPYKWFNIILCTFGVIVLIYICNVSKLQNAASISVITFLVIMISIGHNAPFLYAFNRLLDTGIGIVVSLLVNKFVNVPRRRKQAVKNAADAADETKEQ